PWSYYPRAGDGVYILGLAASGGPVYGETKYHLSYLGFADGRAAICPRQRPGNGHPAGRGRVQRVVAGVAPGKRRGSDSTRGQGVICPGVPPVTGHQQVLAGFQRLVVEGRPVKHADKSLHPRTAVGLSDGGKRLWLMVVDGRQRWYSEGVTLAELSELLLELG